MTPWPVLASARPAPAAAGSPWLRLPASVAAGTAAWPPTMPPAAPPPEAAVAVAAARGAVPSVPELVFGEADVARLAAAAAAAADLDARRAVRKESAAREAAALEHLAASLDHARDGRRHEDFASRRHLALVAAAVARAFAVGGSGDPDRAAAVVAAMLDGLPEVEAARLVVDPPTAAVLASRLPELARRAGFPIAIEVDAGLAPGAVHLRWDGGWADHDPDAIGCQIAELLAAHLAPQSTAETGAGQHRTLETAGAAL